MTFKGSMRLRRVQKVQSCYAAVQKEQSLSNGKGNKKY
jgi:hypothetical protein